ncbi:MAG: hypothetical protein GX625_12925 [Clostridiaceae bacterium]|nr:hypothetical protein [Clostridiaceae bacterium]
MFERNGKLIQGVFKKYFLPTIMMTMALSMGIIVDGIIVGNTLGSDAMAAVNLVLPVSLCFNTVYVLFGIGGSVLASIAKGKRDNRRADMLFTLSVVMMFVTSLIFMLAGSLLTEQLSLLLSGGSNLQPLVAGYLKIFIYGAPLLIVVPGIVYFVRADGRPNLASAVLIVANVVNLILDLVFILGFQMGIGGAALATVLGYAVGLLILLFYFLKEGRSLHFALFNIKELKKISEIVVCGIPSAVGSSLMFIKILSINSIVLARIGPVGMVAFSVCLSCLSFVSMFIAGVAQTMMPIVATLYGEKDFVGVRFTAKKALQVVITSAMILVIIFELFPGTVLKIFGISDAMELEMGSQAIRIFALSLIGTGFSFLMLYYFQITQRSILATAIAVVQGFAVVVPCAFLLSIIWGSYGIWISFLLAEIAVCILIFIAVRCNIKRSNGSMEGLFLISMSGEEEKLLDVTIANDIKEAAGLSEKVIQFCLANRIEMKTANHVGLAVEEMAVNIIEHGYKKNIKNYIDILIKIRGNEVIIALRDNGIPFDPTMYKEDENTYSCSGILLVKALAKSIHYTRLIGLNSSIIILAS